MNKRAVIRNGKIVYDVDSIFDKPNETSARENRQKMKVDFRKDMLQKNQVEYFKAYPEQAKNLNDETRRLLS